jgi:crotonobetainyl-CoA:carnitine CoA-transferase CaiB-like acyl-CoA transferase
MLSSRTLAGLRVIEVGSYITAPYCSKLMADLGAEVTKIEDPAIGGDPARQYGPFPGDVPHPEKSGLFLWLNTNKRGVTLNLRSRLGRQIFGKLLSSAEVLVHNVSPSEQGTLGFEYDDLHRLHPTLVVTAITAFGRGGLYRAHRAQEINCQAAGGLCVATGEPHREPLMMPLSMGAYQAGASAAGASLVATLLARQSGEGRFVDISEVEVLANNHVGTHLLNYIYRGVGGIRRGHHGGYFYYPCACLPCKDGHVCLLAPQSTQWIKFVEIMGTPEWSKEPRYRNRRKMAEEYAEEVDALLLPWLRERTKEEIFSLAMTHHLPFAPEKTLDEVAGDPQLADRKFYYLLSHPEAGTLSYPGAAYEIDGSSRESHGAPLLGEHNTQIYGDGLGYSKREQERLREFGVI